MIALLTSDKIIEMAKHSHFKSKVQLRESIQEHLMSLKEKLAPSTLRVLDVIRKRSMNYSQGTLGVAYLLIDSICKMAKTSRASVERGIRKLEQVGIIKRIATARKTGLQGANMFVFLPSNDGVEMKELDGAKRSTLSSSEADKSKSNTGVFNTAKNKKEKKKITLK
ncbi:hypothetical protein ACLMAB_28835 [Brevibacillus laterosporus]